MSKKKNYTKDYFDISKQKIKMFSEAIEEAYKTSSPATQYYYDTKEKIQYLGELIAEKIGIPLENNYNERPNTQNGMLKYYILAGFIPEKHINQLSEKKDIFIKISFGDYDKQKPCFGVDIGVNSKNPNNKFEALSEQFQKQKWSIPLSKFPKNWEDLLKLIVPKFTKLVNYLDNFFSEEDIKNILKTNKNLILTGAPGTGKTYLAKEIAEAMTDKDKTEFVQFHPSYDYTDFVEGLRPVKEAGQSEIGFELKDGIFKEFCKKAVKKPKDIYVFIIDEINRAEISKVFGELFFSIDPGYRGDKGQENVKTQYSNLQEDGDVFKDGFYVPENVYIIGTMNDIDRSVETFDFAMRRRFAWQAIKADDRTSMWDGKIDKWKSGADKRMKSLNKAIKKTESLSSAYHIGPAYFLKLEDYKGDFDQLWDNHLKGVLFEYLRGMSDSEKKLKDLKDAYDGNSDEAGAQEDNV